MNTSDYNDKIVYNYLLSDVSTYLTVKTDSTNKTLKSASDIIKKLNLDVKLIMPSGPKPPKWYGLSKVHKPNASLHPILSFTN